jgi:hypothetical protein
MFRTLSWPLESQQTHSPSSGKVPSSVYSLRSCPYPRAVQTKAAGWGHDNALGLCLADTQLKVQLGHWLSCLRAFVVCIMKITGVVHRLNHVHLLLNTGTYVP